MSFETVHGKQSALERWGDVWLQTVVASSHWKRTFAKSGQPCSSHRQLWLWWWRRPETATVGIGDAL